ncbi:MAG: HDIG domain-containing protein [Treponema sp.]|nr:HDIG domain-containing protein [Treponema sp.]
MNMKNNNPKNGEKKPNIIAESLKLVGNYIKKNYAFLIVFFLGFLAVSVINFFKISTSETVANFSIADFEIGMIADRNIIADVTIPADDVNPYAVNAGDKIIRKGFPITEEAFEQLKKMAASPLYIDYRSFANSELYLLIISILWYLMFYFMPFKRKIKIKEPIVEVLFVIIVYAAVCFGQKLSFLANPYSICAIIPGVLFSILITILYGPLSSVLMTFIASMFVLGGTSISEQAIEYVPFLYTLVTGLVSTAIVRKIEKRTELIFAALIITMFNLVFMVLMIVIFNETFMEVGKVFILIAANGLLSGILALGLLTPLEMVLNTASVFRLMDLSDLNTPLMRKMMINASGTYQHSMMVAQLSENACREIGANALLARVGAYYHDIGKIDQSEYFVENQQGENKHNELNPTLSASVIKSHVKKGVEKAHQMHLPQVIIDIISEHHGNSVIEYFYNQGVEKDPSLSPEDFAYKGNPPSTKEAAVVMLADTVEAACKAIYKNVENPSVSSIEKTVATLINNKVDHNQLNNCDLTFRDLTKIKEAFLPILAGYYHSRIKYPGQKDDDNSEQTSEETSGTAAKDSSKDTVKEQIKDKAAESAEEKTDPETEAAANNEAENNKEKKSADKSKKKNKKNKKDADSDVVITEETGDK